MKTHLHGRLIWPDVREIGVEQMAAFVRQHHYSSVMPRLTKVCYGGFHGDLAAAISFGWGSRPKHTIQKLFPSLGTQDYLEIGKMCLRDDEPKNAESAFIGATTRLLRKKFPTVKLVFSWADGMWGKPGYIYQASNFLYGGFIWTDVYVTAEGKRIHPLQLQSERRARGLDTRLRTQRPSPAELRELGWKHYHGKQFRYIKFLCDQEERERLRKESPFDWTTSYPKARDLEWRVVFDGGLVEPCEQPTITGTWAAGA